MAQSFAAYASQYLNRQQPGSSSMTSSQPMFFSFTTENGSRNGHESDDDLDDLDDPHLRISSASRSGVHYNDEPDDDDDPYLRLDEDERTGRQGFDSKSRNAQTMPLIPSDDESSSSGDSPKGWLAHLASPMLRHGRARSPSPSPSESSDSDSPRDLEGGHEPIRIHPSPPPPPPQTSRAPVSLSLTESLLPRDGCSRPLDVFSLPDPRHTTRSRRKYNDHIWTATWCAGVAVCLFFCILLLFITHQPEKKPRVLPYTTLLHTVPMLTILTFLSAIAAYTHILLLRIFVQPMMIVTSVFIPATLFISALWAFIGSFMWDADTEPTWGETVGLRLFSLIPLAFCILTARRLVHLPRQIHTTSSILNLTTELLKLEPFLLALSPSILLATLLASIPFLTLIFRLLLIGYTVRPTPTSSFVVWHMHGWANWAIVGAACVWLWTWGVARGVLRMTTASVIGAWYFADPDAMPPPPMSTHTIHAALTRSTGPSFGTVALSALILTIIRILTLIAVGLQRLPAYLPARLFFMVGGIRFLIGYIDSFTTALSKYALVYTGLTGDPFMPSARRARALTNGVESKAGRFGKKFSSEPPLAMLTISPLTLTFPFALTTYLFVAHTLNAPDQALGAALLAGTVTGLVGLFCVGLVKDTADALYICYCIDKDSGQCHREEVFAIFEYDKPRAQRGRTSGRTEAQPGSPRAQPEATPARHHRKPGFIEPRQQAPPQHQYTPSESTTRYIPRQPLSPPSPSAQPGVLEEEALDPFERSYTQNNPAMNPTMTPANFAAATAMAAPAPLPPARPQSASPPPEEYRMQTSAEMNAKSWTRNPPNLAASVSQSALDTSRATTHRSHEDSEDEGTASGSQYFPGSGLFSA